MEPEAELPALKVKDHLIGAICELSLRRYIRGQTKFDRKFSGTLKSVKKERARNLKLAHKESDKSMGHLESYLEKVGERSHSEVNPLDSPRVQKVTAGSWNWSWALDEDEHPPPSSIVSRRDTREARKLAMIADLMPENTMSGNNLWQHLVTFLTAAPDKKMKLPTERDNFLKLGTRQKMEIDLTNVSTPPETGIQIDFTTEPTPLAQTNGTTLLLKPLSLGSTNTGLRRWSHWTRGSLWKERFRVHRSSKTPKRGSPPVRTPTTTQGARTLGSALI